MVCGSSALPDRPITCRSTPTRPPNGPSPADGAHAASPAAGPSSLLHRAAARAIFDRTAASRDRDDRDYAVADLLAVAEVERRTVPTDLARKLADDPDKGVAARGAKLVRAVSVLGEHRDTGFYSQFGM